MMNENSALVRRKHVERMNGRFATWWHYNQLLLSIFLLSIAGCAFMLRAENEARTEAEAKLRQVASHREAISCYTFERSTSLILAAGSKKQLDEALLDAAAYAGTVRMAWRLQEGKPIK